MHVRTRVTLFVSVAVLSVAQSAITASAQPQAPIKIYVDESRSLQLGIQVWKGLSRRDGFARTRVLALPSSEQLQKHDVMIVWNQMESLPYSKEELDAIRKFVESGGGLLLAGNPSPHTEKRAKFRSDRFVDLEPLPTDKFSLNQLAGIFRLQYSNGSRAGIPGFKQSHPLFHGVNVAPLAFRQPLSPLIGRPEEAESLIEAYGEPVAVSLRFGRGRVIVCSASRLLMKHGSLPDRKLGKTQTTNSAQKALLIHWLRWLAQNSPVRGIAASESMKTVLPGTHLRGSEIDLYCIPPLREQAEEVMRRWEGVWSDMANHLGVSSPVEFVRGASSADRLQVYLRASKAGGLSGGTKISIPACGGIVATIGVLGHEVGHKLLGGCNTSVSEAFAEWLGSRALVAAGFTEAAKEKMRKHLADFRAIDPHGNTLDVADPLTDIKRSKACQGKWIWIIFQLCDKHGDTFVRDYLKALRSNVRLSGSHRKLVDSRIVKLTIGDHVTALSEAAGEDLGPWFKEMGISVGN